MKKTKGSRYIWRAMANFNEKQFDWLTAQVRSGNAESIAQILRKLVNAAMWTTEEKQ